MDFLPGANIREGACLSWIVMSWPLIVAPVASLKEIAMRLFRDVVVDVAFYSEPRWKRHIGEATPWIKYHRYALFTKDA